MVCSYEEIIGPSCLLHRGKSKGAHKLTRVRPKLERRHVRAQCGMGSWAVRTGECRIFNQ